jgi:hypothetical protein
MQFLKFIVFASFLASCNAYEKQPPEAKNDTTEVLKVAIAKAFYQENLPGISPLMKKYRFSDSLLFSSDSLSLDLLPINLDSINFKILKREQICSMIKKESDSIEVPNYLYIRRFEKNDTGDYVQIQSLSCLDFGGGGSIGVIVKKTDSLRAEVYGSSSIN